MWPFAPLGLITSQEHIKLGAFGLIGLAALDQKVWLTDEQTCRADRQAWAAYHDVQISLEIYFAWKVSPIFGYSMSHEKHGRENVNLLNLALCKSLPRITFFSSSCKPLLQLKWNSPPNKLGFVKCQLSNHRRLRSIQVLIVSRSCQTHNDDSVSYLPLIKLFHSVGDKSIFADDDTKCVLFTALICCLF